MDWSDGPWANHTRAFFGYELAHSSTHTTVTVNGYMQLEAGWYSNATRLQEWSGYWGSGSENQSHDFGNGASVLVRSWSESVARTDVAQSLSFALTVRNFNGAASHSMSLTVPARVPFAPTDLTVTRVSDTQHTVAWTRNGTYLSVVVQRSTDGASWVEVGRPSGNPASFTDTTTVPNQRYYYRVAAVTAGGQSPWSDTFGPLFTTPAAPTGLVATRIGLDIEVDAAGLPPFATSYNVYDGVTLVGDGVSLPWVHVSPNPVVTHTYTIRARVSGLTGPESAPSNTVQLLAPPTAPSGLTPNGGAAQTETAVRFAWVHNPVDTTAQTAYELRYRVGAGAWTTLSGTTASYRDVTLALDLYEWQVRTKGQDPGWSPWSAVATVTIINRPGVAILDPGATWDRRTLDTAWSWFQAQSRPQSSWQAELLDDAMVVLESRTGAGAGGTLRFNTRVADGGTYTVRVRAATGEVWSEWASQTFTVAYTKPNDPTLTGAWDEMLGCNDLSIVAGQEDEETPATVSLEVERSVDGGATWEPMVGGPELELVLADWECLSNGTTLYRVTGYTADGAAAEVIVPVVASSGEVWLSGGVGYSETCRLPYSPKVGIVGGLEKVLHHFAGHTKPTLFVGEAESYKVSVSGSLRDHDPATADTDRMIQVAQMGGLHMLRDPDGRRRYGALSPVSTDRTLATLDGAQWGYGFTLTEAK